MVRKFRNPHRNQCASTPGSRGLLEHPTEFHSVKHRSSIRRRPGRDTPSFSKRYLCSIGTGGRQIPRHALHDFCRCANQRFVERGQSFHCQTLSLYIRYAIAQACSFPYVAEPVSRKVSRVQLLCWLPICPVA